MSIDKLESIEGYNGLFHEITTGDCYKLKQLTFIPDIIFDLGGNVGVFARYARQLYPKAKIISVEPNPDNYSNFLKFTDDDNITIINKAIGIGKIWHYTNPVDFAHQTYLSRGIAYPLKGMRVTEAEGNMQIIEIKTVMPDRLINKYIKPGQKSLIKIDIEGNEHCIFTHQPSIDALKKVDYIAIEVHFYALTQSLLKKVRNEIMKSLHQFDDTHIWELNHVYFYAIKK